MQCSRCKASLSVHIFVIGPGWVLCADCADRTKPPFIPMHVAAGTLLTTLRKVEP